MKKEPMPLVAKKCFKNEAEIEVFQNSKVTYAVLTYYGKRSKNNKQFYGKAVKSDKDEFDSYKGIDLAIARAKKNMYQFFVNETLEQAKKVLNKANRELKDIEFITRKYGLNKQAREEGENYKGPVYRLLIMKMKPVQN